MNLIYSVDEEHPTQAEIIYQDMYRELLDIVEYHSAQDKGGFRSACNHLKFLLDKLAKVKPT